MGFCPSVEYERSKRVPASSVRLLRAPLAAQEQGQQSFSPIWYIVVDCSWAFTLARTNNLEEEDEDARPLPLSLFTQPPGVALVVHRGTSETAGALHSRVHKFVLFFSAFGSVA